MKSTNSIRRQSICHLLARLSGLLVITSLVLASLALVDGWSMRVLAVPFLGIVHLVLLTILEKYDSACWKTRQWAMHRPERFQAEGTLTCFLVWLLSGQKKMVGGVSLAFLGRLWRVVVSLLTIIAVVLYALGFDGAVPVGIAAVFCLAHGYNAINICTETIGREGLEGYYSPCVVTPTEFRKAFIDIDSDADRVIITTGKAVVIASLLAAAIGFLNVSQPLLEWAVTCSWAPALYLLSLMVGVSWQMIVLEGVADIRRQGDRAQKIRGILGVLSGIFIVTIGIGTIALWMHCLIN